MSAGTWTELDASSLPLPFTLSPELWPMVFDEHRGVTLFLQGDGTLYELDADGMSETRTAGELPGGGLTLTRPVYRASDFTVLTHAPLRDELRPDNPEPGITFPTPDTYLLHLDPSQRPAMKVTFDLGTAARAATDQIWEP